jgi:predicted dehydrogenase
LVEKPIATTESEANEILTFCAENEINLGVNYFRNYDPVFVELINDIGDGRFGSFLFGNCVYSGGLLNNGSHYINLLNSFFGIPSSIHNDLFMDAQEPSGIGFQLGYGEAAVVFQELDVDYQLGEMELYFTRARVRLDHCCEKISVSTLERNKTFPTSQSLLENEIEAYRPNNDQYQYSVIEQVVRSMDADEPFSCSGREALETLRVCLRVRKHEE